MARGICKIPGNAVRTCASLKCTGVDTDTCLTASANCRPLNCSMRNKRIPWGAPRCTECCRGPKPSKAAGTRGSWERTMVQNQRACATPGITFANMVMHDPQLDLAKVTDEDIARGELHYAPILMPATPTCPPSRPMAASSFNTTGGMIPGYHPDSRSNIARASRREWERSMISTGSTWCRECSIVAGAMRRRPSTGRRPSRPGSRKARRPGRLLPGAHKARRKRCCRSMAMPHLQEKQCDSDRGRARNDLARRWSARPIVQIARGAAAGERWRRRLPGRLARRRDRDSAFGRDRQTPAAAARRRRSAMPRPSLDRAPRPCSTHATTVPSMSSS